MLPKGLKLFLADVEIETNEENIVFHTFWYVVGRTYDSALKRFIKEANKTWDRYKYYFFEADEEMVRNFMEYRVYEDIKADIYEDEYGY